MTNATLRANAPAMPNRRAALGILARTAAQTVALAATPAGAAIAPPGADDDAEIVALSAEICALADAAREIQATRVEPYEDNFHAIFRAERDPKRAWTKAWAYSAEVGRDVAVKEVEEIDGRADKAFYRMIAIPATGQAGRAAKVRALLVHVVRDDWRGPAREIDWDIEQARALLGELAGMSAAELEKV